MAGRGDASAPATAAAGQQFYVTRDSQNISSKKTESRKLSYVGMRNLTDLEKIDERDIVSTRGTIRGIKNRVRAGLANFENPNALEKLNTEKGKVVVYVTSFRGVRATFEECRYVLDLFHNLRIRVSDRDIYMHQFYYRELEERLRHSRGQISLPQIFISGQHIGGMVELEELNEAGELRKILAEFPRYETAKNCTVCSGFQFIPCHKCGGSKNSTANKFTTEFRALRCTYCNENGMEVCPVCEQKRKELEEELRRKNKKKKRLDPLTRHAEESKNKKEVGGGRQEVGSKDEERESDGEVEGAEAVERVEEQQRDSDTGKQEGEERVSEKGEIGGDLEAVEDGREVDVPNEDDRTEGDTVAAEWKESGEEEERGEEERGEEERGEEEGGEEDGATDTEDSYSEEDDDALDKYIVNLEDLQF